MGLCCICNRLSEFTYLFICGVDTSVREAWAAQDGGMTLMIRRRARIGARDWRVHLRMCYVVVSMCLENAAFLQVCGLENAIH